MNDWWLNFLLIYVTLLIPIIGYWRLFEKAQEKGWKALIPFYNTFVFFRIIRRPAWWISLYLLVFIHPSFCVIIFGFDAWRCHTLFGMNVEFYSSHIISRIFWAPLRFGRIIVYAMLGYPNISFNRKVFYSTEYLEQLSKDKLEELKKRNRGRLKKFKVNHKIAKLLGIPLWSYDLAEDIKKDEDISWPHISGPISALGLFIYFWIADWDKPGFTDADISKINNPFFKNVLDVTQQVFSKTENHGDVKSAEKYELMHAFIDFIANILLYSVCSLIGGFIIMYLLNYIFRVFNNLLEYFKLN